MANVRPPDNSKKQVEQTVKLGDVKPGNGFRLGGRHGSYETALDAEKNNEEGFFMVLPQVPAKTGRVLATSLDGQLQREFDSDRFVVPHKLEYIVHPATMVDDE